MHYCNHLWNSRLGLCQCLASREVTSMMRLRASLATYAWHSTWYPVLYSGNPCCSKHLRSSSAVLPCIAGSPRRGEGVLTCIAVSAVIISIEFLLQPDTAQQSDNEDISECTDLANRFRPSTKLTVVAVVAIRRWPSTATRGPASPHTVRVHFDGRASHVGCQTHDGVGCAGGLRTKCDEAKR
jgi:hypothetical protein